MKTMSQGNGYFTLIGSLPALPADFTTAERVPISRRKLNERLKMLKPRDSALIDKLAAFLVWERQPLEKTDEEVVEQYERFLATVDHPLARELIVRVMTVRTILAALRHRRLGQGPPPGEPATAGHIARHWSHPDFRLAPRFPWIGEIESLLDSGSLAELDLAVLYIGWRYAKRLSDQHAFSIEAVILYLIRWEMVYRWTRRDATAGREDFERLTEDAMGEHVELFSTPS